MDPPPNRANRALMLAVGNRILERVVMQGNDGLAKACLNVGEKAMVDFMVEKGILLEVRREGIISLFLAKNTELN